MISYSIEDLKNRSTLTDCTTSRDWRTLKSDCIIQGKDFGANSYINISSNLFAIIVTGYRIEVDDDEVALRAIGYCHDVGGWHKWEDEYQDGTCDIISSLFDVMPYAKSEYIEKVEEVYNSQEEVTE